jgi:uncharacterized membrane protein YdjX (TVP38/TMEM64 family)
MPFSPRPRTFVKPILLLLVVIAAVWAYERFGGELSLESLAARESDLRAAKDSHPAAAYGLVFLVYAMVTGLSIPGAAALSLVVGWFFGFLGGVILVSCASTTGAAIAFLLSRYFFRDLIQRRFAQRLIAVNEALTREGTFYLFTLRLIPIVPYFVVNLVMGLTRMRLGTFWLVSQVGMLPGTCVYLYAGSSVPTRQQLAAQGTRGILSWRIVVAFTLLGLFPFVVRFVAKKVLHRERSPEGADRDRQS